MQFEELISKPIEDMTDEELDEVARSMDISQLKALEKKIKKGIFYYNCSLFYNCCCNAAIVVCRSWIA